MATSGKSTSAGKAGGAKRSGGSAVSRKAGSGQFVTNTRSVKLGLVATLSARRFAAPKPPLTVVDKDALDALDWMERGMPEQEIGYTEAAPKLTAEQLAEFRHTEFLIGKRPRRRD